MVLVGGGGGWWVLKATLVFIFGPNLKNRILTSTSAESKKDGELRNQVHEEGFESEEGWLEIL